MFTEHVLCRNTSVYQYSLDVPKRLNLLSDKRKLYFILADRLFHDKQSQMTINYISPILKINREHLQNMNKKKAIKRTISTLIKKIKNIDVC